MRDGADAAHPQRLEQMLSVIDDLDGRHGHVAETVTSHRGASRPSAATSSVRDGRPASISTMSGVGWVELVRARIERDRRSPAYGVYRLDSGSSRSSLAPLICSSCVHLRDD